MINIFRIFKRKTKAEIEAEDHLKMLDSKLSHLTVSEKIDLSEAIERQNIVMQGVRSGQASKAAKKGWIDRNKPSPFINWNKSKQDNTALVNKIIREGKKRFSEDVQ